MGTIGNTPVDIGSVPLSSVLSPNNSGQSSGNVTPVPLQGHPGSFIDGSGNATTSAMMGYLYPQIVQGAHAITGSSGKTLTCAFANNNNQGNSVVVCVGLGEVEAANITLTITDSNSNVYNEQIKASQSTTLEAAIFLATKIAAGANTVTVTIAGSSSSNTAIAVQVYEVWGLVAVVGNALDQTSIGSSAGSTNPVCGAIAPSVPNEFVFAALASAGGTITAGSGFTLDSGSLAPTGGNLVSFGVESQFLASFASLIPSATLGTSNAWAMACASFKSIAIPVEAITKEVSASFSPLTSVASSASTTSLLAANPARRGMLVFNDSTATLYLAYAATASTSAYSVQILAGGYWEMPKPICTGAISGIWSAANGNARITELY